MLHPKGHDHGMLVDMQTEPDEATAMPPEPAPTTAPKILQTHLFQQGVLLTETLNRLK